MNHATPEQLAAWRAKQLSGMTPNQRLRRKLVERGIVQADPVQPAAEPVRPTASQPRPQSERETPVLPPATSPRETERKPGQGALAKKPWDYRATAVIPHRDTPEHLELCLQFLAQQSERPYVMVVDTGSADAALARVLALRSESVEVHQIACHATEHRIDCICAAMDLAMSVCRTEYLWCLHSDCFVINRNMLAELLLKSDGGRQPVIGYESVSANKHDECKGMVSHTCTLLHMPTMHELDVTWSRTRLESQAKAAGRTVVSDAEMALNYRLRDRGVKPLILGPEQAAGVERDANRVHLRSATLTAQVLADTPRAKSADEAVLDEMRAALKCVTRGIAAMNPSPPISHRLRVSIIVTARNYGRFLGECLASCLAQTERSIEVIYSDDASTDESLSIARSFSDVRTIQRTQHTGVCAARNRAVAASRGDVLIHVDGDDRLPPDFVTKHLQALNETTPFVYGPAQAFGLHDTLWAVQPWSEKPIWEMNFCNTSSAIWRRVFDAAGGWRENPSGTLWDWDLFLRAQRFGTPAPSEATLQYRQHSESWSHTYEDENDWRKRIKLLGLVRHARVRLSIGCIYSGRLPGLLRIWLDSICQNVADAGLSDAPDLLILDNSADQADALYRETGAYGGSLSSVRILRQSWPWAWDTEIERRKQVATFMAVASNRILAETSGELVWLVEDDVLVPSGGLKKLFMRIIEGHPLPGAVSGAYQNRHTGEGWVSGFWTDGRAHELPDELGTEPMKVDLSGTGCLMFWRELAPRTFDAFLAGTGAPIPAHDWVFSHEIRKRGRDVLLLPDVRCRHYKTENSWI